MELKNLSVAASRPLANFHPTVCTDRFLVPTPRPVPRLNQSVVAAAASSRPLANFHPSVWGDRFLVYTPDPSTGGEQEVIIEELKEEVKRELKEASTDDDRLLKLVDAIQRLGIEYHFEEEIDEALQNFSENFEDFCKDNDDMYTTSLAFRLLRQQGYRVSCRIFDKFKDDAGGFKVPSVEQVAGVLELFEATHLRVHDEETLDDAYVFTRNHLETLLPCLSYPVAEQVHHALHQHSNRRGLPRVEARHFISIYAQFPSHHQRLLTLAKLDFNMLQSMHKRELAQFQRWWNDLDVPTKLPYARDRLVETYFWVLGVYFEPKYSLARKILTKLQAITSLLDDTYDAYATFEELQLFTQAFESWSFSSLEKLPDALKIIYKAILVAFEEFEEDLGISRDRLNYGIEAMKFLVRNYFAEAKWREEKYKPTSKEYMEVATATTAYMSLIIMSFIGMGDNITKETFDFVFSKPKVVRANLIICRLTDDIMGHEFDREREHVPSWVECYTEEHQISKKEADLEFKTRIESAWKDINEAFLKPTQIPTSALVRILNFTRVIEVMYTKGDWYTHVAPQMQTFITQLLIDPVP